MSFGVSASSIGTTTASALIAVPTGYAGLRQGYQIWNNSAQILYVGGTSGLTAAAGFPVPANTGITLALGEGESVYGIAVGGTVDARILQI